jgi:hypothetical protein
VHSLEIEAGIRDGKSFAYIAREIGISRERVRQIAHKEFGVIGRERRLGYRYQILKHPFVDECVRRGMSLSAYPAQSFWRNKSRRVVTVNGYSCFLGSTCARTAGSNSYLGIRGSSAYSHCDFGVWPVPQGFLIIPQDKWPMAQTMFSLREKTKAAPYSKRHDWPSFLNKFDQLEKNMEIQDFVAKETVQSKYSKFFPVIEKLRSIPPGFAMPVKCDSVQEAQYLQQYIFQSTNKNGEFKYSVQRRKETVYISQVTP